MASVTLRAFAKINLSLRVTGARPDGFHDVRTILQAIDLFDRVTCDARRGPFEIRCDMPGVPTDRTNLVWKAAQLLWEAAGRSGDAARRRRDAEKKIPMQAGLGGGSSDAAAALLGLRRLWKLRVPDEQLHAMAARLGSDVPFFLVGGTALGLGRGDEVYPLERSAALLGRAGHPAVRRRDQRRVCVARRTRAGHEPDACRICRKPGSGCTTPLVNDLEGPVMARHPVIGQLKQRLTERGALMAAMSGSGSTVFGVFKSAAAAAIARRAR